jgi:hypothetical protein
MVHELRRQSLEDLTRRYLHEAQRLGYGVEEVGSVLDNLLDRWLIGEDLSE